MYGDRGLIGPGMNQYPDETPGVEDVVAARRSMFLDFCALLEARRIQYVILPRLPRISRPHPFGRGLPGSRSDFDRLPALFASEGCIPGATLVQVLRHEAASCYYVFARQVGSRVAYLHADAAGDYRLNACLWLGAISRRPPAASRLLVSGTGSSGQFEDHFVKRVVDKALFEEQHARQLARNLVKTSWGAWQYSTASCRESWLTRPERHSKL